LVYITEEASAVLDDLRSKALEQIERLPDGIPEPGLRLVIQQDQPSLAIDIPHAGDQVIRRSGHPVLLIDPDVIEIIDGSTVDIEHAPTGDRLVIGRVTEANGTVEEPGS
jgi:hypothetical protein